MAKLQTPLENVEVYVGWEEVYVCSEKGRREIHYVLKRKDGGSDLAVIAKEKSLRHMTYRFLLDFSSFLKPKSRREVVDWLNSFTPDLASPVSPLMSGGSSDGSDPDVLDVEKMKDTQLRKLGRHTKEFMWVGFQWTCKRRRKHYQAFRRNGVKISVNQFVHVLAEENKRLVAYLDDLYEDAKGNKMVVVRWFHKIDEVGVDLPHNFNDQEIFFSLCLQDLSIECIDGFATVLSSPHYAKFVSEAKHTQLQPYVCCQQYDNNDLKPLDITQVKGYWKQDVVRYMFSLPSARALQNQGLPYSSLKKEDISTFNGNKPRKRLRLTRECKVDVQSAAVGAVGTVDVPGQSNVGSAQVSGVTGFRKENFQAVGQNLSVGSVVEVLSQDSGIRGCWFRATIIKKHKDKVKLCYHDIKDAENEVDCLEEWILASRIAVRDETGLRLDGRPAIRPSVMHNDKASMVINFGTIVDAWWHDGWWEGEKQQTFFSRSDLRHSLEWLSGTWKELSERADVAAALLSDAVKEGRCRKISSDKHLQMLVSKEKHVECDRGKNCSCGTQNKCSNLHMYTASKKTNSSAVVDLLKDDSLSQLKWKSSCKRRRSSGFVVQKLQSRRSYGISPENTRSHEHDGFLITSPLKVEKEDCESVQVEHDNCKYMNDSLFSPSVVTPLTSLVMSR
ncbi:DUF724 domain-containing protein 3 [Bienertia sinuspersici]